MELSSLGASDRVVLLIERPEDLKDLITLRTLDLSSRASDRTRIEKEHGWSFDLLAKQLDLSRCLDAEEKFWYRMVVRELPTNLGIDELRRAV